MALFDSIFAGKDGLAEQLLQLMGITGTVFQKFQDNYDPISGTLTDVDELSAIVDSTPPLTLTQYDKDFKNQWNTQLYCYVDGVNISGDMYQFDQGDVQLNDTLYNIVGIKSLSTGENIAAYKLFLRENNK